MTAQPMTTWDGKPVSPEPPHGVTIVVYRRNGAGWEFLILHRAHHGSEYEGDWAWTPPAGSRYPGEPVDECARRELREETGLELPLQPTTLGTESWYIYAAEAIGDDVVVLDAEHDRFEWTPMEVAMERCLPAMVGNSVWKVAQEFGLV